MRSVPMALGDCSGQSKTEVPQTLGKGRMPFLPIY